MKAERFRQLQADRQIAITRLILALFTAIAAVVRSSSPASLVLTLSSAYILFASAILMATMRTPVLGARFRLTNHLVDFAFIIAVNFATGGYRSPFFSYLFFSCTAAAFFFSRRGTLLTVFAALAGYLSLAGFDVFVTNGRFDTFVFAVRIGWLVVVGVLLHLVSATYETLERERRSLALFPRVLPTDLTELMAALLRHAGAILECDRVIIVWEESEEPWLNIATLAGGEVRVTKEPPGRYRDVVDDALRGETFVCEDVASPKPLVYRKRGQTLLPCPGPPVDRDFADEFSLGAVIGVDLTGEVARGTLLVCDCPGATLDELILGEIVGALVASRLDQHYLVERSQETAVNAERVRLARELHDGLLQSFTGVVLQLENIHQTLDRDPAVARQRITEVQGVLMADQRELRNFILELRPRTSTRSRANFALASRLEDLRSRFVQQWGLDVGMKIGSLSALDSQPLRHEIFSLISEGIANAAKHAQATRVDVALDARDGEVSIVVSDNGQGFPFKGRYDLQQLIEEKRGPVTLKERVISLGGNMVVHSSDEGARLEIRLPVEGPDLV